MQHHFASRTFLQVTLALAMAVLCNEPRADWAPERPISIVVPYPPGGSSDVIARAIGVGMALALETAVIVDNRPGASTLIGSEFVRRSSPDGYTLYLVDVPFVLTPFVVPSSTYMPVRDFTPVAMVGTSAQILWTRSSGPPSLAALVEKAKAQPGELALGSAGAGTNVHLMVGLLQKMTSTSMLTVPYTGAAPMFVDIASGTVEGGFSTLASAKALYEAKRIRPIAISGDARKRGMPDIPTFSELGLKALSLDHWWGIVAPAGVPEERVAMLKDAVEKAIETPSAQERFEGLAIEPAKPTPAGTFRTMLDEQVKIWSALAKAN